MLDITRPATGPIERTEAAIERSLAAARDRTDAETRALAERLLDVIADAPEHERVERLAGALRRS